MIVLSADKLGERKISDVCHTSKSPEITCRFLFVGLFGGSVHMKSF